MAILVGFHLLLPHLLCRIRVLAQFFFIFNRGLHSGECLLADRSLFYIQKDNFMATKHEILESIPFFNVLDREEMESLAVHMELHTAAKYANIFSEGDPADYFYILSEGSV